VLEVFEDATIDTQVDIIGDKFPHYAKYVQPKPKIIVTAPPPTPAPKPAALPAPTPGPTAVAANGKPGPGGSTIVVEPTKLFPIAPPTVAANAPANTAAPKHSKGAAPLPIADYRPPAIEPEVQVRPNITVSNVSHSAVAHAMEGSILSAGLPDAPKISMPTSPAPKDVTRFGTLSPNSKTNGSGLSLQDPIR
jgi:hypothetical protein